MYSPSVIDRRLHKAAKSGTVWKRLTRDQSIERAAALQNLRYNARGELLADGALSRPLTRQEEQFIVSESCICRCDFEYWFTRYASLELDPGVSDRSGIGPPVLLESQRRYIELIGRREADCHEEKQKYQFTQGILVVIHKVRQVVATATIRAMSIHRMLWWNGTRALAASLDEPRVSELFKRDHVILDNLPFWQRPTLYPDVKDTEIGFAHPINSRVSYQAENQQQGRGGLGVGTQAEVSHLTETALWVYPGYISFSFIPSIPKAVTTLHVQESTARGKGNYWHQLTEDIRRKKRGYEHWTYIFIPWYMNRMKYRSNPPDDWVPQQNTIRHAVLIERTSPEFYDGRTIQVGREQLYWWESEREAHIRRGELNTFLTNYPATPEQSFQSFSDSALPVDLLERMEQRVMIPKKSFDVEVSASNG